ncbi:IS110 family transposase [Streptomyces mirabilis]|uniref:IS110 family transposase n=1 Tax=Streptomyces mirabilis TaxID=68239 RepID=UPI0036D75EEB
MAWARSFGVLHRAGVECTGSYGTALTRSLRREGIDVVEINQPDRATRRKRGKTDAVDADAAARAVLSGRATTVPKTADGPAADMRVASRMCTATRPTIPTGCAGIRRT